MTTVTVDGLTEQLRQPVVRQLLGELLAQVVRDAGLRIEPVHFCAVCGATDGHRLGCEGARR